MDRSSFMCGLQMITTILLNGLPNETVPTILLNGLPIETIPTILLNGRPIKKIPRIFLNGYPIDSGCGRLSPATDGLVVPLGNDEYLRDTSDYYTPTKGSSSDEEDGWIFL